MYNVHKSTFSTFNIMLIKKYAAVNFGRNQLQLKALWY